MSSIKRILLIIALLAGAILIGLALYYGFKKTRLAPPAPPSPPAGPPGVLPPAGVRPPLPGVTPAPPVAPVPTGPLGEAPAAPEVYRPTVLTPLTSDLAVFPSVNTGRGEVRYHNPADGKFYRVTSDGKVIELSDQVFYNVSQVTWAAGRDKAVLEYPDGANIVYDFENHKQVTLPKHWEEFSWSPEGREIAAKSLGLSPENRWLVVAKEDGTGTELIEPLGENADRVKVTWSPSRQTVALSQTGQPLGLDRREVLFVGLHGENFRSTIVEGLDFVPQWSPTGRRLLYSVDSPRSGFKPELWIVDAYGDAIGNSRRELQLNTWATKCAFAGEDTLYCAVPRELPTGAGMAPEIAAGVADDLYKIDLKSGLKFGIPLDGDYTIMSLLYDAKGSRLFMTDQARQGIFEVNL